MSDIKCNMKCFECIFRDCTQNTGLTPEESKALFTWLPEEAKKKERKARRHGQQRGYKVEWLETAKYIAEWEHPLEIQIAVDRAIQALKEESVKNIKEYVAMVKEQAYKDGFEGAKQEIISDLDNICTAGGIWQKFMTEYIKAFKKFVAEVDYEC